MRFVMKLFERDEILNELYIVFAWKIFSENPFSKTICLSNFFSWCRKKVEALTTVVRWSVSILFKIHGILYYISRGLNLFSNSLAATPKLTNLANSWKSKLHDPRRVENIKSAPWCDSAAGSMASSWGKNVDDIIALLFSAQLSSRCTINL